MHEPRGAFKHLDAVLANAALHNLVLGVAEPEHSPGAGCIIRLTLRQGEVPRGEQRPSTVGTGFTINVAVVVGTSFEVHEGCPAVLVSTPSKSKRHARRPLSKPPSWRRPGPEAFTSGIGDDDDRAAGVGHHMLTHRTKQNPGETAMAPGTYHQHGRVLACTNERFCGVSLDGLSPDLHPMSSRGLLPDPGYLGGRFISQLFRRFAGGTDPRGPCVRGRVSFGRLPGKDRKGCDAA